MQTWEFGNGGRWGRRKFAMQSKSTLLPTQTNTVPGLASSAKSFYVSSVGACLGQRSAESYCLLCAANSCSKAGMPRNPANSLSAWIFLGLVNPSFSAMRRYSIAHSFIPARTQPLAM
jgi:hypothetical protein